MSDFSNMTLEEFKEKLQLIFPDCIVYTDNTYKIHVDTNYFLNNEKKVQSYESLRKQ